MCSLAKAVCEKVSAFSTLGGMEPGLQCERIFGLIGSREKYWQLFPKQAKKLARGWKKKKSWDLANERFLRLEENQRKDTEGHNDRPPAG